MVTAAHILVPDADNHGRIDWPNEMTCGCRV
jgi:hypothetical protein